MLSGESLPAGTGRLRVITGYDPEARAAYAVFQDDDSRRDLWSHVEHETTCYHLKEFGTTAWTAGLLEGSGAAEGHIDHVKVEVFED